MIKTVRMVLTTLAASAALAGCMTVGGVQEKEGQLAAAGFTRQQADTPQKMAKLQALPQNRLSLRSVNTAPSTSMRTRRAAAALHRQRRRLSAVSADPRRQQHRADARDDCDAEPGSRDGLGRRVGSLCPRLVLMARVSRRLIKAPALAPALPTALTARRRSGRDAAELSRRAWGRTRLIVLTCWFCFRAGQARPGALASIVLRERRSGWGSPFSGRRGPGADDPSRGRGVRYRRAYVALALDLISPPPLL